MLINNFQTIPNPFYCTHTFKSELIYVAYINTTDGTLQVSNIYVYIICPSFSILLKSIVYVEELPSSQRMNK